MYVHLNVRFYQFIQFLFQFHTMEVEAIGHWQSFVAEAFVDIGKVKGKWNMILSMSKRMREIKKSEELKRTSQCLRDFFLMLFNTCTVF